MQCPACHYQNPPQSKFCRQCGRPLPAAPPAVAQNNCAYCARPLRTGARFCGGCGQQQPVAAPVNPMPPPAPTPVHAPPAYQPPPAPQPAARPIPPTPTARPSLGYILHHTLISGLLVIGLLLALGAAFFLEPDGSTSAAAPEPPPQIEPEDMPLPVPTADYRDAVVEIGYGDHGRFGLKTTGGDPATTTDDDKNLTFDYAGATHNTRLWIDGDTPVYGSEANLLDLIWGSGDFSEDPHIINGQLRSAMVIQDIAVSQTIAYVYGSTTGRVDTIQIKYTLTNESSRTKEVGLRLMIDTLIGNNDGVPFVVPGRTGIASQAVDLRGDNIPDFIQALENPNLADPGVIVNLTLQGADATPPDRVVISAWCDGNAGWDYYEDLGGDNHPLRRCGNSIGEPDSAIGLYYNPEPLPPGESRTIVTYYGLGGISSTASQNASLSLSFNRTARQDDTFWVTALIMAPQTGQSVRLQLPEGLSLAAGYTAEQPVAPGGDYTQVSWQVVANAPLTDGQIIATLQPDNISESQTITVMPRGITR